MTGADVVEMMEVATTVHVADVVKGYLVDLADASRHGPDLLLGVSPRATLNLLRASRRPCRRRRTGLTWLPTTSRPCCTRSSTTG